MSQQVTLKDGSVVLIRAMTEDDAEGSYHFFQLLREEDRAYLRIDVTRRDLVEARIRGMASGQVKRLVAVAESGIVADGALELEGPGWRAHLGEMRLIVAPAWRRKGLGMMLARELYRVAASEKVQDIVVKVMRPQAAVRNIFYRLGFHEEATLRDYVRDLAGRKQDLIVMKCDLEALWQQLEERLSESDWQRVR